VITGVNIAIPTNVAYDFVPNGGVVTSTRSVVDVSSCDSCHNGKGLVHSRKDPNYCVTCHTDQVKYSMSSEVSRSLTDPLALTSMSSATDNGTAVLDGRALGNYPNLVHKIHMGNELSLSGYNYKRNAAGRFDQNEWIQDPRDCTKCHSGDAKSDVNQATQTKDGNNWKTKPSRLACGACHDNVNFATGVIYEAGGTTSVHPNMVNGAANAVPTPYTDDSSCSSCHGAADISVYHRAEAPTANNPTVIAGISTISYDLKSVVVASSTGATAFTFRIIKDGTPVTALTTGSQAIPGFNSGPSFYVAYAVPQDGIAAPADFNAYSNASLASLISATNGTLTGPDTSGYWTATLTAASLKVPTSGVNKAAMVTGAIIGNFTQVDFNATKTAGLIDITTDLGKKWNTCNTTVSPTICPNGTANPGLFLKTPLAKIGAKLDTTAYSLRRVVVDTNKCESCHEQLGAAVEFHSGARNDATSCAICHNPNRTSSGWAANASTFIHGIHAGTDLASVTAITKTGGSGIANVGVPGTGAGGAGLGYNSGKRYIPFSWHRAGTATVPTWNAAAMVYPGILKRCENCHVPNAVNFGASGSSLLPTLLWSTSAARGSLTATAPAIANPYLDYDLDTVKAFPRDPVTGASPYPNLISASGGTTTLGVAFSFAASTGVSTAAAGTTLVESPVTAACFACHNANTARLHMTQYGGVIYGTRTANYTSVVNTTYGGQALNNQETCLICHGMGRDQDAAVVHAKK
jgi:OmcA/MtrC family decaheme c-type cytochrome